MLTELLKKMDEAASAVAANKSVLDAAEDDRRSAFARANEKVAVAKAQYDNSVTALVQARSAVDEAITKATGLEFDGRAR